MEGVSTDGLYLYLACGNLGIRIIDPPTPSGVVGVIDTPDSANAVASADSGKGDDKIDGGDKGEKGKQVGIYSGAGYLYPNSDIGDDKLVASVWQSTLRMGDKTHAVRF